MSKNTFKIGDWATKKGCNGEYFLVTSVSEKGQRVFLSYIMGNREMRRVNYPSNILIKLESGLVEAYVRKNHKAYYKTHMSLNSRVRPRQSKLAIYSKFVQLLDGAQSAIYADKQVLPFAGTNAGPVHIVSTANVGYQLEQFRHQFEDYIRTL